MTIEGHSTTPAGSTAQVSLQRLADRLVTEVPAGAGTDVGLPAGVVLGVSIDGRRATAARGLATLGASLANGQKSMPLPATVDTAFDLASVTKVAGTTAALLRLVSAERLSLDTSVLALVPGFSGHAATTVRDLLQHSAGLWEWQPLYLAPRIDDGADAVLDGIAPRYPLRSGWHYSDLGFMVLGRVIECVTGRPLDAALHELVFAPLGMLNTLFDPHSTRAPLNGASDIPIAASSIGDRAEQAMVAQNEPYPVRWTDDGFGWREHELVGEVNDGNCFHAFGGRAGHAGLFSTVDDLLTLTEALIGQGPGPEFARPDVVADFFAEGQEPHQALGFRRTTIEVRGTKHPLLWHPGFTGCAVGVVPDLGIGVTLLSNRLLTSATPVATSLLWEPVVAAAVTLSSQNIADTPHSTDSPNNTDTRTP